MRVKNEWDKTNDAPFALPLNKGGIIGINKNPTDHDQVNNHGSGRKCGIETATLVKGEVH
ncbi:hypothetical protein [Neptunicella sp.]|uniref:hypothetical protein n=1 Tax=Neptunicella sp. TaxID=2125986 RepID=UPI003F68D3DB